MSILKQDMKFRVHSPEHSVAIQKRLFELGYKWSNGDEGLDHRKSITALYAYKGQPRSQPLTYSELTDYSYLHDHRGRLTTLDDLYNPELLKESCEGKPVEIDGKRYKLVLEE